MVFSLATVHTASAQVGLTSVPFLRIEPDAKGSALGGAGSTLIQDTEGFYNPAALGWQKGSSALFSYANWMAGATSPFRYNRFGTTLEVSENSSIAASLSYLNLGEQFAMSPDAVNLGRFSSYQMATTIAYGMTLSERLAVGASIKHIYSSLASGQQVDGEGINPGSSIALDLGALWRSEPLNLAGRTGELRAGVSLSNVGPGISYMDGQDRIGLPQTFRAGVALQTALDAAGDHSLTLSSDVTRLLARMEQSVVSGDTTWNSAGPLKALFTGWGSLRRFNGQEVVELGFFDQFTLGSGVEYTFRDLFSLRSGFYMEHPENGGRRFATYGAGFKLQSVQIDFSYLVAAAQHHPLDGTIRISLRLHFGEVLNQ